MAQWSNLAAQRGSGARARGGASVAPARVASRRTWLRRRCCGAEATAAALAAAGHVPQEEDGAEVGLVQLNCPALRQLLMDGRAAALPIQIAKH